MFTGDEAGTIVTLESGIFDITDPTNPTYVSHWDNGGANTMQTYDIKVSGKYLYALGEDSALNDNIHFAIIDISDPSNPTTETLWITNDVDENTSTESYQLEMHGDYV